jgi:RsiW-degrading membrane proteinase PrsW (M82 family)
VQELATGDYFGETALLTDQTRNATVRVEVDTELLALRRPAFVDLLQRYPKLHAHVAEMAQIRAPKRLALEQPAESAVSPQTVLPTRRLAFWVTLILGLGLFIALDEAALLTGRPELSFAVLLVGALVGPTSYVVYLASTNVLTRQPLGLTTTFVIAGAVFPLAVLIELVIGAPGRDFLSALKYGFVEELVKLLAVVWLLRRPETRFQMDGVIYGAAAGMGFSWLETVIYGFRTMNLLPQMLDTLWLRALLSPFSHGTWTAIIAAAMWKYRGTTLLRMDPRVVGAFAISVALHTAWDWLPVSPSWYYYYYLAVGAVGLAVLGLFIRNALLEQARVVSNLNQENVGAGPKARRARLICWRCRQTPPAGASYCPRCGAAIHARS